VLLKHKKGISFGIKNSDWMLIFDKISKDNESKNHLDISIMIYEKKRKCIEDSVDYIINKNIKTIYK